MPGPSARSPAAAAAAVTSPGHTGAPRAVTPGGGSAPEPGEEGGAGCREEEPSEQGPKGWRRAVLGPGDDGQGEGVPERLEAGLVRDAARSSSEVSVSCGRLWRVVKRSRWDRVRWCHTKAPG